MWLILALLLPLFVMVWMFFIPQNKTRVLFFLSQSCSFLLLLLFSWLVYSMETGRMERGKNFFQKEIHSLLKEKMGEGEKEIGILEKAVWEGQWWLEKPLSHHPMEKKLKKEMKEADILETWQFLIKHNQKLRALALAYHYAGIDQYGNLFLWSWIPDLNLNLLFGVHRYSLLLLWFLSLFFFAFPFFKGEPKWSKGSLLSKVILEFSTIGLLCSLHLLAFYGFWILSVSILYFAFQNWALPHKRKKGLSFLIHHMFSSFLLFVCILYIGYKSGFQLYSLPSLFALASYKSFFPQIFLLFFLIPFSMALGFFPFHTSHIGLLTGLPSRWQAMYGGVFMNSLLFGWIQIWLPFYHLLHISSSLLLLFLVWGIFQSLYFSLIQLSVGSLPLQIGFTLFSFLAFSFLGGLLPFLKAQMTPLWMSWMILFLFTPLLWGASRLQEVGGIKDFHNLSSSPHGRTLGFFLVFYLGILGLPGTLGFVFLYSLFSTLPKSYAFFLSIEEIWKIPYGDGQISFLFFLFYGSLFLSFFFLALGTLQVLSRFYTSPQVPEGDKKDLATSPVEKRRFPSKSLPICKGGFFFFILVCLFIGCFPKAILHWLKDFAAHLLSLI